MSHYANRSLHEVTQVLKQHRLHTLTEVLETKVQRKCLKFYRNEKIVK